jgi:hypothetical protein
VTLTVLTAPLYSVQMKTTLVLDDDLYRQAKVTAAHRGVTVASVVEEALRLMLLGSTDGPASVPVSLPSWDLGEPLVDINDNRALREALDADRPLDALR